MAHLNPLISDLALILGVAGITTLLFKKLKQPVVLGYIVAGFLCSGNFLLEGVSNVDNVNIWAEIGIIFLLFSLGLEFSFNKLLEVGGSALMTALVIILGMMCTGYPAANVKISLYKQNSDGDWAFVEAKVTDQNGRIKDFLPYTQDNRGIYKLTYHVGPYFESQRQNGFYPFIDVVFQITDENHYHVPITLSPFGYSTYRGN